MPLVLADRVRDTTTTTGTGTVTLSGTAPTGYQNFSVIGNGNTTYYTINAGSQWEVGIGTYSSTGPTLSRDTVLESSNANALVNFAAGVKDVFVTYPSDEAVYQDGATIAAGTAVLGVANGGTGVTTSTGTGSVVLNTSPTLVTPTLGAASATSIANGLGAVGTPSYTFTGDLNTGMWSPAADTLAFSTAGNEIMRITSAGQVGIGTTTPTASTGRGVDASGYLIARGAISLNQTDAAVLQYSSNQLWLRAFGATANTGFMTFRTGGGGGSTDTERMRIDSAGNVGIGTSAPAARVHAVNSTLNAQLRLQDVTTDATNKFGVIGTGHFTNAQSPILAVGVSSLSASNTVFIGGGFGTLNAATALQFYTAANNTTLTGTEVMRIDNAGQVGIGGAAATGTTLRIGKNLTGAVNSLGVYNNQAIQSDVTTSAQLFSTFPTTAAAAFTLGSLTHFSASQSTIGATSAITNQYGFLAQSTLTGATNNYGFFSNIASGTGRWNFYAGGTAVNYFAGNVGIGTTAPGESLVVEGATPFILVNNTDETKSGIRFADAQNIGERFQLVYDASVAAMCFDRVESTGVFTERMRITAAGNLGIGTTSPSAILETASDADASIFASTYVGSAVGGNFIGRKARGSQSSPSGILSGDTLTSLLGRGYTSAAAFSGNVGAVAIIAAENFTATNNGTHITFATTATGATSRTERMRIDSAGNVGIGNSSPPAALSILRNSSTASVAASSSIVLTNKNTAINGTIAGGIFIDTFRDVADPHYSGGIWFTRNQTSGNLASGSDIVFGAQDNNGSGSLPAERMRINSAGNLGIGTSSPTERLDTGSGNTRTQALVISGDQHLIYSASSTEFGFRVGTGGPFYGIGTTGSSNMRINSSSGGDMLFAIGGTERARINNSGQFLVGTSSGGRTVCVNAADNWIRQSNPSRSWLIGPSTGTSYMLWDETGGGARFTVDTSGNWFGNNAIILGSGFNNDNRIEIGQGRTGNNYAYIDLIGDTTYTDFGLRLLRGNTGANTFSQLYHRGTGDFSIGNVEAAALTFATNGSERMRIGSNGGVAIGGTGTDASLHIQTSYGGYDRLTQMSPSAANKPALNIAASKSAGGSDQWWSWGVQTDNTWKIQAGVGFGGNGISIDNSGNLTASGNVTAYSDARLKKDVETIDGALDLVSKMRGVRYTRTDTDKRGVGVIAQEMLEVVPEVVQQGVGDDDTLSVAYGNLVGVLIEAIKELRAEVEELKGK